MPRSESPLFPAWRRAGAVGFLYKDYAILSLFAILIALTLNASSACIWFAAAAFARQSGRLIRNWLSRFPFTNRWPSLRGDEATGLIALTGALWAGHAGTHSGALIALGMLGALSCFMLASHRPLRDNTLFLSCLGLCSGLILAAANAHGATLEAFAIVAISGLACFFVHDLAERMRAAKRHAEETEFLLSQKLLAQLGASAVIWRMDMQTRVPHGAERLAALLGTSCTQSLLQNLFNAPDEDRDLVSSMLAPECAPTREIHLAHTAQTRDGGLMQLRHRALIHADAQGRALSLTCVTIVSDETATQSVSASVREQIKRLKAHYGEASLDESASSAPSEPQRQRA